MIELLNTLDIAWLAPVLVLAGVIAVFVLINTLE